MNQSRFEDVIGKATEITISSQLQRVLSNCDVSEVLFTIQFLRTTIFPSIDPHFVSGSLFLRIAQATDQVRGNEVIDMGIFAGKSIDDIAFELHPNSRIYQIDVATFDPRVQSVSALVYEFTDKTDIFWFNSNSYVVPAIDPRADSQFCGRTFFDVSEALREYARKHAYPCKCPTLETAWTDDSRTFFKPRPESTLRDSLKHFLDVHLSAGYNPDYEVRAEQNMDDTHPTDIKVTKQLQPRIMIIEVKWLGDSVNADGTGITSHRDAKAIDGAKQLGTYLDANRVQAPRISALGYYVIFDGRRKGLKLGLDTYEADDLLHYESIEIDFGALDVLERKDFTPPLRMFIMPKIGNVGSRAGKK